jgi:7-cyano-7-deazaguanine synthase
MKPDTRLQKKAVLLMSGGPDSATLAYWAKEQGYKLALLFFMAGMKTERQEIAAAEAVSKQLGLSLEIFDLSQVVGALGGKRPMIHSEVSVLRFGTAMCLSPAVCYANEWQADTVFLGLHAGDVAEGAEYTREFLDLFQQSARVATGNTRLEILTPFLDIPKAKLIEMGAKLGVPYRETWSCINSAKNNQCGLCGACKARHRAFEKAGIPDPTCYESDLLTLA